MNRRVFLYQALAALSLIFCLSVAVYRPISAEDASCANTDPAEVIADFNGGNTVNNLGGESGVWERYPDDAAPKIAASVDKDIRIGDKGGSLKLEYDVSAPADAANGFWTQLNNFNAAIYDHFDFWVHSPGDVTTPAFKIEFKKERKDEAGRNETIKGSYIVRDLKCGWQKVSIPMNVMNGIQDWGNLKELVITFEKKRLDNPRGVLHFDDFTFVKTWRPGPRITDIVPHKKNKMEREGDREAFARFLISKLRGFPKTVFVSKSFPKDDRKLLIEIARDTWGYFDDIVDKEHGLPLDNIRFNDKAVLSKDTVIGDYTNITNIGLYLICVISGYDLGFIDKNEAVARLNAAIESVDKLEKHNGFPYNYYDVTIFQRTSNFISFVDSGWLAAGLIVAKNAFPQELGPKCKRLLDDMNFSFFYDPVEGLMYHGFYTNIDYYSEYQYGVLYAESRAISYIAIGKGDVPREHWFHLARTFPDSWPWQTQMPGDRSQKEYSGYKYWGGYYEYEEMKFVPSWGGSMFEALMPPLIIDEKNLAPMGLGLNNERHAKIQARYAMEKLGYPVFGMSPCSIPGGGYTEYGVKALGIKGYKPGVVTPHASFLALEFAPEEAIKNIRQLLKRYKMYGEYGFYDSVNISTGKVGTSYLCLDQAMSFIALNNYLNDGIIRKRFHGDPIAHAAEELIKFEDFFSR